MPVSSEPTIRPQPASSAATETTLERLGPGRRARIVRLVGDGPIRGRLFDLGFAPGTEVRMLRRAPLADPIAFEVRGSRICLRRDEAALVHIEPLP